MLSYAFQVLNEQGYKNIATEDFDNTAELCAAILSRGIAVQIKRGLGREYIPVTESRAALRGKLEISDSIKSRTILKKQMVCTLDEFIYEPDYKIHCNASFTLRYFKSKEKRTTEVNGLF